MNTIFYLMIFIWKTLLLFLLQYRDKIMYDTVFCMAFELFFDKKKILRLKNKSYTQLYFFCNNFFLIQPSQLPYVQCSYKIREVVGVYNTNNIIEYQLLRNFLQYHKVLSYLPPLFSKSNINPFLKSRIPIMKECRDIQPICIFVRENETIW